MRVFAVWLPLALSIIIRDTELLDEGEEVDAAVGGGGDIFIRTKPKDEIKEQEQNADGVTTGHEDAAENAVEALLENSESAKVVKASSDGASYAELTSMVHERGPEGESMMNTRVMALSTAKTLLGMTTLSGNDIWKYVSGGWELTYSKRFQQQFQQDQKHKPKYAAEYRELKGMLKDVNIKTDDSLLIQELNPLGLDGKAHPEYHKGFTIDGKTYQRIGSHEIWDEFVAKAEKDNEVDNTKIEVVFTVKEPEESESESGSDSESEAESGSDDSS